MAENCRFMLRRHSLMAVFFFSFPWPVVFRASSHGSSSVGCVSSRFTVTGSAPTASVSLRSDTRCLLGETSAVLGDERSRQENDEGESGRLCGEVFPLFFVRPERTGEIISCSRSPTRSLSMSTALMKPWESLFLIWSAEFCDEPSANLRLRKMSGASMLAPMLSSSASVR